MELTKPGAGTDKVITVDGGPAVVSKSNFGGVALSAADLDLMKARLDELRKDSGGAAAKPAASTSLPVVPPSAEGSFADILRQRATSGSGASSSASGSSSCSEAPTPAEAGGSFHM